MLKFFIVFGMVCMGLLVSYGFHKSPNIREDIMIYMRMSIFIMCVSLLGLAFVPTTNQGVALHIIPKINSDTEEVNPELLRLARKWVEDQESKEYEVK